MDRAVALARGRAGAGAGGRLAVVAAQARATEAEGLYWRALAILEKTRPADDRLLGVVRRNYESLVERTMSGEGTREPDGAGQTIPERTPAGDRP